jgi:hypothetical protein
VILQCIEYLYKLEAQAQAPAPTHELQAQAQLCLSHNSFTICGFSTALQCPKPKFPNLLTEKFVITFNNDNFPSKPNLDNISNKIEFQSLQNFAFLNTSI